MEQFKRQVYYTHGKSNVTGRMFTIAVVIRNGNTYMGVAQCSLKDQFSRPAGRSKSLSNAVHNPIKWIEGLDVKRALDFLHYERKIMIG